MKAQAMSNETKYYKQSLENKPEEIKDCALGITILHNGKRFRISSDNYDDLVIYSLDDLQIVVKPKSGNVLAIGSER